MALEYILGTSLPAGGPPAPGHPQSVLGRDHPAGDGLGAQLPPEAGHGGVDDEGYEEHEDGEGGEEQGGRGRTEPESNFLLTAPGPPGLVCLGVVRHVPAWPAGPHHVVSNKVIMRLLRSD